MAVVARNLDVANVTRAVLIANKDKNRAALEGENRITPSVCGSPDRVDRKTLVFTIVLVTSDFNFRARASRARARSKHRIISTTHTTCTRLVAFPGGCRTRSCDVARATLAKAHA